MHSRTNQGNHPATRWTVNMTYPIRLIDRCREKAAASLLPIALLLCIPVAGCSDGSSQLPSLAGSPATDVTSGGPISEGDPCASDGAQVDCGTVVEQLPDAVVCALGSRTCNNGVWGSCVPNGQRHVQSRRESIQTVGATSKCAWNVCDPYCQQIADGPPTVVPGPDAGFLVQDGGVILDRTKVGSVGSTTCTGLSVTASTSTLSVTALSPVTTSPTQVTFTADLLRAGCYPNATPVLWTLDRTDIATIDTTGHLTLVRPLAVPITVTGHSGAFSNSASVQVSVSILNTSKMPSGISAGNFGPITPTNPASVCDYAISSTNSTVINTGALVTATGSNSVGSGTTLSAANTSKLTGHVFSKGAVTLSSGSTVTGNVSSGSTITSTGATVSGTKTPNTTVTLPAIPTKTVTCGGTSNTTVAASTTTSLAPGSYGNYTVANKGTLALQAGQYNFNSLTFTAAASAANAPLLTVPSSGYVIINVCGTLSIGDYTSLSGVVAGADSARLQWYVNGNTAISIPVHASVDGIFVAPNAAVTLNPTTAISGLVYASSVTLAANAQLDGTGLLGAACRASGMDVAASQADTYSDTLSLLYPYAQTVFPLGLAPPLLQWATGTVGPASAVKITLRYPATGTPNFSWSAIIPESSTLWLNPPTNSIPLAAGPRAAIDGIDNSIWKIFEQTAQGDDAAIVLQRLTGTTLRQELATTIHFANDQLKGTVYYHSYGTLLVQNYSSTYGTQTYGAGQMFGAATLAIQPGASVPAVAAGYSSATSASTDATSGCHVCHSGSASGNMLVTNLVTNTHSILYKLGTDPANGGTYLPTRSTGAFSWGAIYPDGTYLFSNSGPPSDYSTATAPPGGLEGSDSGSLGNALYSLNSGSTFGTVVATTGIPSGLRAALPSFSPDGKYVAFNHYGGTVGTNVGDKRSLGMMSFNVSTKTFSGFRRLYTEPSAACSAAFGSSDPCTSVWPSFLPDSSAVVFEREIFNDGRVTSAGHADFGGTRSGCDDSSGSAACGDDGTKAQLWWVTTAATPSAARLNAANGCNTSGTATIPVSGANGHTAANEPVLNYEPTVSPQAAGGYNWVAFTSRRSYGNVATINPWWSDPRFRPIGGQFGPTTKKIWVSAIDGSPTAGADPSHPAFYLPGQELLAGNAKAFWALEKCTTASATKSAATLCDTNLDCCGATGSSPTSICALDTPLTNPAVRHCLPLSTSGSCIADNSATTCLTDAQCCNATAASPSLCVSGKCQPPPPITIYKPAQFTRDFVATCPVGQSPIWREVQWKGSIPASGSINFSVQTSKTEAGLSTAPLPSTPLLVTHATTADLVAFTTSSNAVAKVFVDADVLPQVYLRLTILLNPSSDNLSTPILTEWRQLFDCVDSQ